MNIWHLKLELKALILLLIRTHPAGLRVLIGECPAPESEDIRNMLCALRDELEPDMRVDGRGTSMPEAEALLESEEKFMEVVEAAGGWLHINSVTVKWAQRYRKSWAVIVDHAESVGSDFSRIDESQLKQLAEGHDMSPKTIMRYVQEFPGELARIIILSPSSKWDLEQEERCA